MPLKHDRFYDKEKKIGKIDIQYRTHVSLSP